MNKNIPVLLLIVITFFIAISNTSCKKEKLLTAGGELRYSTDTLTFDTVFTSLGSFTTQVKIYNPQNQKVNISSIRLGGGDKSFFHINVNGISRNATSNIELEAKDSMYVFATVTIDPRNQDNPFIVQDSLIATMNGNDYILPFLAYGQDAHYIYGDSVGGQTWGNKDKRPYVVIDGAIVERNKTLNIVAGTRIYMHAGAFIYVDGTLTIDGTKKDSVIFQGDRLDRKYFGYEGYPGEWGGIYFTSYSAKSNINYAVLKNCGGGAVRAGIYLTPDSLDDNDYQVKLKNTIIDNSIAYGIVGFRSTIYAQNCLITNCGAQALATFEGGQYDFDNCTFATYGSKKLAHTDNPVMALVNYRDVSDEYYIGGALKATLRNCVIWGGLENELFAKAKGTGMYDVTLQHCLIRRADAMPAEVKTVTNCILNQDPLFVDYNNGNFRVKNGSPVIDKGMSISFVTDDLDGKSRGASPDIGCYEY